MYISYVFRLNVLIKLPLFSFLRETFQYDDNAYMETCLTNTPITKDILELLRAFSKMKRDNDKTLFISFLILFVKPSNSCKFIN